ncbi:MAG: hypothetical protein WAT19_05830 [Ferruginibacter sp.]
MTQWELYIYYGAKDYKLKADLEYHSSQIMRIRVHGKQSSILLENNYPLLQLAKSKKGIQWKIREGGFVKSSEKDSRLLMHIMEELERIIKKELP